MTTNNGGPAFPSGIAGPEYGDKAGECFEPGMSLRAYHAAEWKKEQERTASRNRWVQQLRDALAGEQ